MLAWTKRLRSFVSMYRDDLGCCVRNSQVSLPCAYRSSPGERFVIPILHTRRVSTEFTDTQTKLKGEGRAETLEPMRCIETNDKRDMSAVAQRPCRPDIGRTSRGWTYERLQMTALIGFSGLCSLHETLWIRYSDCCFYWIKVLVAKLTATNFRHDASGTQVEPTRWTHVNRTSVVFQGRLAQRQV